MAMGDSDLKWVLAENEVTDELQAVLLHNRFKSLKLFVGLGEDRGEVRESLKAVGLNVADGLAQRQQVATVLSAWTAAKEYISKESTAKAESRANHLPRPIGPTEYQAMKAAVEAQYGRIKPQEAPSRSYVGTKAENVDDNEITAEELTEVTSRVDTEVDMLTATLGEGGALVVKKGTKQGRNPTTTEELRTKLAIMNNVWLFLRTKHSNRPWLVDFDDRVFRNVADHILGDTIYGLKAHGSDVEISPTWTMVLKYEMEMRKKMSEWVSEGDTLKQASVRAIADSNLRDLYIVTPLALSGQRQPADRSGGGQKRTYEDFSGKGGKPRGKGKGGKRGGKSKGKGFGKSKKGRKAKTRSGAKPICFKFNNPEETCDGSCDMLHVCQYCLSPDHGRTECTN
jgi:hypothetical protein